MNSSGRGEWYARRIYEDQGLGIDVCVRRKGEITRPMARDKHLG
jgi:hypothetical protein